MRQNDWADAVALLIESIKNPMNKPLDLTKPVQTLDGRPARIIATGLELMDGNSILFLVKDELGGHDQVHTAGPDGYAITTNLRLVNVPPPPQLLDGWLNVYSDNSPLGVIWHVSKGEADRAADDDRIACIRIKQEFQPGDGL